ncbi:MAG: DNA-processing protein DprA [Planctomycetota bacterium]
MTPEQSIEYLRLHLATLYNGGLALRLVESFGSTGKILQSTTERLLKVRGMSPAIARRLHCDKTRARACEEWNHCRTAGITLLPTPLASCLSGLGDLPDMPLLLFALGKIEPEDSTSVGIVGSRKPTPYSLRQTARFSGELAEMGATIVSGLARGIDACAHRAALDSGGRTMAILGSGLQRIYPAENKKLAGRLTRESSGALLSEFPCSMPPRTYHFPQRNRLISALSRVLLVIQAGRKSGSLITARWALEQGKDVFVLPSRVDEEHNQGGLDLLRDGASVATCPDDLLYGAGITRRYQAGKKTAASRPFPGSLGSPLEALFRQEDGWHPDALAAHLAVPSGQLLAALGQLEMEGFILKTPAGFYRLK